MKYKCPKCGNIFDGQPSFCPHCGTKLNYQTQTDTNLNVSTIANEATKDVKSEAKPYEKYIDECKNYTIISLVTSIIAILSVIIMICVPFINSVLDEKVSLLNIFIQYTKIVTDSSFNTSSTYSYFILINYIYLICIILTLGVLLVTSIIEFVKNIIRLANKKDYAMEFYFNEQKGRDDVSNFFKKGLWRGTNITTNSTISPQMTMPHNKKCKSTLIPDAPKQGKTGQKIQQTSAHEAHHSETHVKLGAAIN